MIKRTNNKASTKPEKKQWATFHRIKLNSRLFLWYQKGNSFDCLSHQCLNQVIERSDLKNHVILDYNLEEAPPPSLVYSTILDRIFTPFCMLSEIHSLISVLSMILITKHCNDKDS
jgi:hypothetical protein